MARLLFRTITRGWPALALGLLLVAAFAWWAIVSLRLAQQIDRHEPSIMRFSDAVAASKKGEVYARFDDATLDCRKSLAGPFGNAFGLVDREGRVAAMAHLPACKRTDAGALEGVFLEPPYLLYGNAVAQGWSVTPGHLAYLDPFADSGQAWRRVRIGGFGALASLAYAVAIFIANRSRARAWRVRGLGFWLLAVAPWLAYVAHDYMYVRLVPVPLVAAIAAFIALAMVVVPDHPFIQRVTHGWGLDDAR
jgi:hypothetical protein